MSVRNRWRRSGSSKRRSWKCVQGILSIVLLLHLPLFSKNQGRVAAQNAPIAPALAPLPSSSPPPTGPPPPPTQITNGVEVTSTIRFSGANLTALTESATKYTELQTNFKDRLILSAQSTGYTGQLQVRIDAIKTGGLTVDSTTWFMQATTFDQPQVFADILIKNVAVVFASSSYFIGLPSGQITSSNVTVAPAASTGSTSSSGGVSLVVWVVVGLGAALVFAVICILFIRYSLRKEDDFIHTPMVEDGDDMIDYDPEEAYAQLVAEAQGYERQHPQDELPDAEKISMPAMPEESPWHPAHKPNIRGPRSMFPGRRKATSGPIMFTTDTPDSRSGPVAGKSPFEPAAPTDALAGGAPNRLRSLIRSISGPVKVVWPSPPPTGGGLQPSNRAASGNWSGLLGGRWSGALAQPQRPSSASSRRFSGPMDGSTGSSRRGGGIGDVPTFDGSEKSVPGSAAKVPPRPPPSVSAGSTDSPAPRRFYSGPLSLFSSPGHADSTTPLPEADVSPLFVPGQRHDSAVDPPEPMAMLRSDSHKWGRGSGPFRDLRFTSGPLNSNDPQSVGERDSSSSLAQMRRPPPQYMAAQLAAVSNSTPGGGSGRGEAAGTPSSQLPTNSQEMRYSGRLGGGAGWGGGGLRRESSGPVNMGSYIPPRNVNQKHVSGPVYFA